MNSILTNNMEELNEEDDYEPKLILEDGSDMSEDGEDDLEEKHASLMASIKAMTQNDQKKVIERTIGSADVSEFGFNKTGGSKINIGDLISTLNSSNQGGKIKKQVKSIGNEKIADIPLEKPQQERLVRGIAYKAITEEVSKWQPLIQQNRKAEQLTFPLQQPNYSLKTSDEMTKRFQPRTPLEREIALLLHGSDNVESRTKMLTKAEERALKAMSLEEAKERRAELMKFRALMTYSETRFRRQKKIKSKGYRKILRKEKMKKEEKELDSLQKTDPERYLEKIEYADKARVEERMSLKHRGGSKFARKKMMYARYDPVAREAVQDMISKNKELTKKEYVSSDDSDGNISMDEDQQLNMITATLDSDNPWMKAPSKTSEFVRPKQISNKLNNDDNQDDSESEDEILTFKNSTNEVNLLELEAQRRKKLKRKHDKIEVFDLSNVGDDENKTEVNSEDVELEKRLTESMKEEESTGSSKKKKKKTPKKKAKKDEMNEHNDVSDITEEKKDIEDLFNILENTEKLKKNKKLSKKEKKQLKKTENKSEKIEIDNKEINDESLSISTTRKTTMEDLEGHWSEEEKAGVQTKKKDEAKKENARNKNVSVDPKKLFTIQPSIIKTKETSEIVTNEDDDDIIDDEQRMTIAEAFADDDVIEEFTLEKKDIIDESKPKDIDLVLPGWGDWGGDGLQVSKKKKKKYTIKKKAPQRKDSRMGNVIMNEKKDTAVAQHQVKDLPRQFLNIKQFEQSISQPIGNTWNPEKAYHRMIQPKIVTQAGAIIKPIDKEEMFKKQKIDKKAGGDIDNKREDKKRGVVKGKGKNRNVKGSRKKR